LSEVFYRLGNYVFEKFHFDASGRAVGNGDVQENNRIAPVDCLENGRVGHARGLVAIPGEAAGNVPVREQATGRLVRGEEFQTDKAN
jgi:hypothetical protein